MSPFAVTFSFLWLCLTAAPVALAANSTTVITSPSTKDVADCTCGYYDGSTKDLFTESIIVYFNETRTIPNSTFAAEQFRHPYERAWNAQFRQGASKSNLQFENDSLQFYINPTTQDHLVDGAGLKSVRQDILYGSFRSFLMSPQAWAGGSALSMMVQYNDTETVNIDLMNTNKPSDAWVSTIMGEEFPDRSLGMNYTDLANKTANPWNFTEYRMDWTKKGINFYVAGNLTRAVPKKKAGKNLPSTPSQFYLRHWSTGNFFSTQGPPIVRNPAAVGWVRVFFNSSSTTTEDAKNFDSRCHVSQACSVDDTLLRGSSPYFHNATSKFHPKSENWHRRWGPILTACCSISLSTFLLIHAIIRRSPWEKLHVRKEGKPRKGRIPPLLPSGSEAKLVAEDPGMKYASAIWVPEDTHLTTGGVPPAFATPSMMTPGNQTPGNWTPWNHSRPLSVVSREDLSIRMSAVPNAEPTNDNASEKQCLTTKPVGEHKTHLPHGASSLSGPSSSTNLLNTPLPSPGPSTFPSRFPSSTRLAHMSQMSDSTLIGTYLARSGAGTSRATLLNDDMAIDPVPMMSGAAGDETQLTMEMKHRKPTLSGETILVQPKSVDEATLRFLNEKTGVDNAPKSSTPDTVPFHPTAVLSTPVKSLNGISAPSVPAKPATNGLPAPKKRVDYLAGLVAVSSLLVTGIHFCLTFIPATINPGAFMHYKSEIWARKTIDSFLLNLIWIGPFLMTSTKFLVISYLKNGDLKPIAEKTVGRTSRLLVPICVVVLLEYFLMDCGAVTWLIYLPSVTWSTWPFTTVFSSFANLISEIIELAFLIPNSAPQITFNYCTGVLWTIPVQLQGSWQTILAVIMVREIKTAWKRFGFYFICIVFNWYALSWGSYFYIAIMLADLEVTYKWRKWLSVHPFILYPLILLSLLLFLGGLSLDMATQWTLVNYSTFEYGVHPDPPTGLPISQTGAAGYPQYYVPKLNGIIFSVGLQVLVELSGVVQKVLSVKVLQYVFPHIFTIYLIHGFVFWSLGAFICVHLQAHNFPYWLNLLLVATACYGTIALSVPFLTPILDGLNHFISRNIWEFAHEKPAPRRPTLFPFPVDLFDRHHMTIVEKKVDEVDVERGVETGQFTEMFHDHDDEDGHRPAMLPSDSTMRVKVLDQWEENAHVREDERKEELAMNMITKGSEESSSSTAK